MIELNTPNFDAMNQDELLEWAETLGALSRYCTLLYYVTEYRKEGYVGFAHTTEKKVGKYI